MKLNKPLFYPVNKIPTHSRKESLNKGSTNIINLILPGHKKGLSSFKINQKLIPKLFLSKKRHSLKINNKVLSSKENDSTLFAKEKKLSKSNSSNHKLDKKKLNIRKNNSFYIPNHHNNINNIKNETFSKLKLIIKNAKSFSSSRNIKYYTNSDELIHVNKNNNNITLNRNNKNLKISKPYLLKIKSNFMPNCKTSINLSFYENKQKNDIYFYKIIKNNEKNSNNIKTNIVDKENINNNNINHLKEININESLKNKKRKINLPFSPPINRDKYFRQIKNKKYYIRNNKNESNIPYNKKSKMAKQNSFYNSNIINFQTRKIKNYDRKIDDVNSLYDIDLYKKNNISMSFIDIDINTNKNSFSFNNNDLWISTQENKFEYIANPFSNELEMNHFKIVKFIQNHKAMLIKHEKNI